MISFFLIVALAILLVSKASDSRVFALKRERSSLENGGTSNVGNSSRI